ncbi:hypothetical protein AVEN_104413-1 [Araneus ventricosus]|uniref:Uncharacterized protein n=1 Tax=Araneus ventricosus TaxID=182803 RepID=A0A4Y2N2P3_ARAVE|nr:hypothetical protein AVEN_104413-1 [Araneus ventricosus]
MRSVMYYFNFSDELFGNKKAKSGKMTNWVRGKMTKPNMLIQELVVLPECRLPFLQLTGTPGEDVHLIKKEIEEEEDKRKL